MKDSEVGIVSFDGSEIDTRTSLTRLMDLLGVFREDMFEKTDFRGIRVVGAARAEMAEPFV